MVHEEILAGLKNAIERGQGLQEAMQTMVAAGYSISDIQEAARYVNQGIISRLPAESPRQIQTQAAISQMPQIKKSESIKQVQYESEQASQTQPVSRMIPRIMPR